MTKLFSRNLLACLLFSGCLLSASSYAQQDHSADGHDHDATADHSSQMNRSGGNHGGGQGNGGMMQMSGDDHGGGQGNNGMMRMHERMMRRTTPVGQSAMAVLRDVTEQLQANADTDWSQVNLEALRQHLIDMDRVALYAKVAASEIPGGAQFVISSEDERTLSAIKRMVPAHAAQIQDELGWKTEAEINSNNVVLKVASENQNDEVMIRGLGFAGFMVLGEHHTNHHLMIAGGQSEHDGMNDGENHSGHH